MNLTCSGKVIKYLLFIFNLLVVITGIVILAVGVSVKTIYGKYHTFLDGSYFSLPNMLIATGAILFFVAFFGCCGAIKENWILLGIFSVLLVVIFIFELSIGIAGYVLRDRTYTFLDNELQKNMKLYSQHEPLVQNMWDLVQKEFECCGVNSYKDWNSTFGNSSLPISCCPAQDGAIGVFYCLADGFSSSNPTTPILSVKNGPEPTVTDANTSVPVSTGEASSNLTISNDGVPKASALVQEIQNSTTKPYDVGCKPKFGEYISQNAGDLAGCGIALAVIQLLGVLFSCHLTRQIKDQVYHTT